jgi:hypothetical protein
VNKKWHTVGEGGGKFSGLFLCSNRAHSNGSTCLISPQLGDLKDMASGTAGRIFGHPLGKVPASSFVPDVLDQCL